MKYCKKCSILKLDKEFHKELRNRDGLYSYCIPCAAMDNRISKMKIRYGLTVEKADEIIKNGCGACGIKNNLVIDHNHTTGVVRGALCRRHNLTLGHANDSIEELKQLIDYLERT